MDKKFHRSFIEYVLLHEPFVLVYGKGIVSTAIYAQMTIYQAMIFSIILQDAA